MTYLQTYADAFNGKQGDLAETFGISRAYLSLLLAGKKRPSLELAVRIERMTSGAVPVASWIPENIRQLELDETAPRPSAQSIPQSESTLS